MLEEKRSTRAASSAPVKRSSSGKSKGKSKGMSGFAKFLIVYGAIFVVAIIVIAIVLTAYLSKYEKGQPSHVAESVVEEFSSTQKLKSFLEKNSSIVRSNASVLDFEDSYYKLVEGKKISYVTDSSKTTSELSAYKITADNALVAEIELKQDKNAWKLSSIDTSAAFSDIKGYSVLVPEGSTVTVNGIQLGEDSITGKGIPEVLEYSSQFITSKPEFTTYNVKLASGGVPTVTGTDAQGQSLVFTQNETSFVAGGGAAQSFIDDVKEHVETGVREYALYFEYLAFDLESYILDECEQHEFIFGSENFDPINPWLYNWDYINTHEFREFSVNNYTVYSSDCFTVDVKYDLLITFNHESTMGFGYKDLPDDNPVMDGTWVWVLKDGQWYISDIIINY